MLSVFFGSVNFIPLQVKKMTLYAVSWALREAKGLLPNLE